MSLDGFIAGPSGDMSWLTEYLGPNPPVEDLIGRIGALLVGNRTFRGDDPHKGTESEGEPFGGGWSGPALLHWRSVVVRGERGGMASRRCRPAPVVPSSAFAGFRFPPEIIVLAVRWYLRFGLSYRDVEELLAERGIEVDHVTVYRWVQHFTPLLADAARPCRHSVGDRWYVDETYVKVAGRWRYVYRAIDQYGQIIDVYVSARRDIQASAALLLRCAREPWRAG
jgi:hypothetical protein